MALKMNYQDDVFAGNRKYRLSQNPDGTTGIEDVTQYTQQGDHFGANDINAPNKILNALCNEVTLTLSQDSWSASAPYSQTVSVSGVKATDTLTLGLATDKSTPGGSAKSWSKMTGYITAAEAQDGSITFWCANNRPTTDFPVKLRGVSL